MQLNDYLSIRTLNSKDIHFLLDSSISCLSKYTESIFKGQQHSDIFRSLELILLYVLNKVDTYSVFLACMAEDSDQIVGYIVADTTTNHILFQYTKYTYRRLGIQKNLLMPLVIDESLPITVNWPTKEMLKLVKANKITITNKLVDKLIKESV